MTTPGFQWRAPFHKIYSSSTSSWKVSLGYDHSNSPLHSLQPQVFICITWKFLSFPLQSNVTDSFSPVPLQHLQSTLAVNAVLLFKVMAPVNSLSQAPWKATLTVMSHKTALLTVTPYKRRGARKNHKEFTKTLYCWALCEGKPPWLMDAFYKGPVMRKALPGHCAIRQ